MESLGFTFDGDYEAIQKENENQGEYLSKIFESRSEYNDPASKKYGKNPTSKNFIASIREIMEIYQRSFKILETNVHQLDGDYLLDEEVAFKNALLLHSK
jgi:hypothetical protein